MNELVIAKAVVTELFSSSNVWLLLLALGVFSAVGAFFGKFLGKKGENLATKEDFAQLQEQLRHSTLMVEGIKSEIAHGDWAAREWAALRIKKVEELVTLMHEAEAILHDQRIAAMAGKSSVVTSQIPQMLSLAHLYLPELYDDVCAYNNAYRHHVITANNCLLAVIDGTTYEDAWRNFSKQAKYEDVCKNTNSLTTAAATLLKDIAPKKFRT